MESNSELDIINHLLEVEKDASGLISEAREEADKRVADAKAKYNLEYKKRYDQIVVELEKEYQSEMESARTAHDNAIIAYKSELESTEKNSKAFNALLDKLLF